MKRWIVKFSLLLLIGAVVNVAVAITCHLSLPREWDDRRLATDEAPA